MLDVEVVEVEVEVVDDELLPIALAMAARKELVTFCWYVLAAEVVVVLVPVLVVDDGVVVLGVTAVGVLATAVLGVAAGVEVAAPGF